MAKFTLDQLKAKAKLLHTPKYSNDDGLYWKHSADSAGNASAIIRFLPGRDEDEAPWATWYNHGFKGPTGRWYIERSLTSMGQTDPVGEMNSRLWNRGDEEGKELARRFGRRLNYVSNILVINDPKNPENNGKVFLYRYGKKIMDMIEGIMSPEYESDPAFNPFDEEAGVNFRLQVCKVAGFPNYDKSRFEMNETAIADNPEAIKEILDSQQSLTALESADNYKSYDELKKKLIDVIGIELALGDAAVAQMKAEPSVESRVTQVEDDDIPFKKEAATTNAEPVVAGVAAGDDDGEEEPDLAYFAKLANS